MARTVATLPAGARITDYISLGVITKTFPLSTVRAVLAASGKVSLRERDLPAHVVMYYVIGHRQVSRERAWWSWVGQVNGRDDNASRPNLHRLSIPC
jgi:Insertion element 4 transposase N-terminal